MGMCCEEKKNIRRQESYGGWRCRGKEGEENRPVLRWLVNVKKDLSERELSGEKAQDRVQWRRLIRIIDPHIKVGKDAEEEEESEIRNKPKQNTVSVY